MQPIFKEMITMWSDLGYPLPIAEGKYWLENHFICGFTNDGELHKLYKYKVLDDLSIEITPYKHKINLSDSDFETWEQTVERCGADLAEKERCSLQVIENAIKDYSNHKKVVFTSTGKDSMVTLDLVNRVLPNVEVYFNNTTLDVADTYKMVKAHDDWTIINPDIGFYRYIFTNHFIPTKFARGCCNVFKEGKTISYFDKDLSLLFFMGLRNDESATRSGYEDFGKNPKWGKRDWVNCLPIRQWNEFDVWLYTIKYNLEINPKYHKGYSRVGCGIACPYYTKYTWVLDKYWYRLAYDRWRSILRKDFAQENRWTKLNCTVDEYVNGAWNGGLLRPEPTEEVVAEFMEHKGFDNYDTALQYFNKTCEVCGKNVRQNDVLAMNLKLLGRNTNKIYCKKHLKELNDMSNEDWDNTVADFKRQGCALF